MPSGFSRGAGEFYIPPGSQQGIPATGAVAGKPGYYTPEGAATPADLSKLAGITATPASAWQNNAYVNLGDGTTAHWDGAAWASGASILGETPTPMPAGTN